MPILVMTALSLEPPLGSVGMFQKPVDTVALMAAIDELYLPPAPPPPSGSASA